MDRYGSPGLYRFLQHSVRRLSLPGILLILAAFALRPSVLPAQTVTGNLQGRMLEASGEPVTGMSVTVRGPNLMGERGAITDKDGFFQVLALPPGTYTVRLERVGLRSVEVQEVQVALGRTTNLGELRTQIEPVEMEALVVTAGAPNIDPVHTSVGATLQVKDFAMLPAERDYKSVIAVLPHVTESYRGDVLNVGGATGPENMYFIDGMNATSPLRGGAEGTTLPYNFIRSIEVKVGGYEAQYGKALGAVVNAVTYSGTNEHEVSVFGFATNSALAAESKAEPALRTEDFRSWDVGARVSGPVLRDRLWYSAAYNPRIEEARKEIIGHGLFDDRRVAHLFAGKLTWRALPSVDVEFAVVGDPTTHDRVSAPSFWTLDAGDPDPFLVRRSSGGHTASVQVRASPSSRLLLEGSLARSGFRDTEEPRTESEAGEMFFADYVTNTMWGPLGSVYRDMDRSAVSARATLLLDRHALTGGLEYEDASVYQASAWRMLSRSGPQSWFSDYQKTEGETGVRVPTVFLQDAWRVTERLTLNAGVRWSSQYLVDQYGKTAQKLPNEWQPRVGFVLQLGRPGTQRVFGSYGRFFQSEPGNLPMLWYKDYVFLVGECTSDPRQPGADCTEFDYSTSASDLANVVGDLEVENLDEFTLGYELSLSDFGTLLIRGIRRELRSSFQWGFHPGDPERGAWGWVVGTPGKGDFDFLPPPKREYTALELDFRGGWRNFDYRASYVLSRAWGNFTGLFGSDQGTLNPGGNFTFFAPFHAVNSTGLLPNDRTHVLKLTNVFASGLGFTVGGFFTWQSGTPLNEFGHAGLDYSPSLLVPRGSAGRTPSLWNVDLRLAYDTPCPRTGSCRLFLDALHLGNPQEVTWTDEFHYFGSDEDGNQITPNPNYLKPRAYQPPMMLRVGFEIGY